MRIERRLSREGPPIVFSVWKPGASMAFTDLEPLLKFVAWPKSTPTGVLIREWLASFETQRFALTDEEKEHAARIKTEGFGPEAHDTPEPAAEEEPNDNTKTII